MNRKFKRSRRYLGAVGVFLLFTLPILGIFKALATEQDFGLGLHHALGLGFWVLGCCIAYRLLGICYLATEDKLVVRDLFKGEFRWSEISGVTETTCTHFRMPTTEAVRITTKKASLCIDSDDFECFEDYEEFKKILYERVKAMDVGQ